MRKKSNHSVAGKIGYYTKYQRQKRNLSLNEFAKLVDITPSFLLRLENQVYKNIKFEVIDRIALGFQMTAEEFLRKCQVISSTSELPPLEYYLKELYQLPEEAVQDVKLFLSFIQKKYQKEIMEMQQAHQKFWQQKK